MLETATAGGQAQQAQQLPTMADSVKRYAPPNQRNRLNRRKSADKNQVFSSRSAPFVDHGDAGGSSLLNENPHTRLVALEGCSISEASQVMNDRWTSAMHCVNDPSIDPSERPVMCSEKAPSAWSGQFRLPHQLMSPTAGLGLPAAPMDFLAELCRAKSNSAASVDS